MQYLTYAEYLEWRRVQPDIRDNEPTQGLNIDAGGFDPWTDDVTYTGGTEAQGGYLTEEAFAVYELKARKIIDWWTDMRVAAMQEVPEEVKLCMKALFKLEEAYGVEATLDNPLVASFNTDGYSESYGSASDQQAAAGKQMAKVIRQWLYGVLDDNGVPLLYRGVAPYR